MKMKTIIPMVAMMAMPMTGLAQTLGSGLNSADFDKTAKPGDDFYQFACGGWIKNNPLPAAYSRYGSFDCLAEDNNVRINGILAGLLKGNYAKGTVEQKLSDYYKLAMDSVRRNKDGVKPLLPLLKEMDKAKDVKALKALQVKYAAEGYGVPMGMAFGADEKNASRNILNVYQGGITLGQKEYYIDNDEATAAIREAYKKHIVRMFGFFGYKQKAAEQKMRNILDVETALAKASKSRTELRDVEANYNKMTLAQFKQNYPAFDLEALCQAQHIKLADIQEMVVGQPSFMVGANQYFSNISAAALRDYMEWQAVCSAANYLSDEVEAANFDFFGKTMRGRQQNFPRWKRATNMVEGQMGEALGRMYVKQFFPPAAKERMEKLVKNLQSSLAERIQAQTWMSDTTKAAALDKLNHFYVKIGYPNKWTDLSKLTIDPSKSFYENVVACRRFWNDHEIETKAGKPVDKDEWQMTPQTVNAYYNPTTNEICFPAGILQKPFFDMEADDAYNYGAIGVVIGHEMTHGFDDQGRNYDKDGNMRDWWTASDAKNFSERARMYADFFSAINVLPDLHANGNLTIGENLADHGGLMVSFNAFKHATQDNPLPEKDGFTPEQRFFLSYAGVWAGNITDKEIRNLTKSDPHSLGKWRVDGALPHIDMWYDAFGIKEGDKMFIPKANRLDLW